MLLDGLPTAFVDLETTGAGTRGNGITEIAIVRADANGQTDEWSALVHPGREIPLTISALTGIHNDMVANAPAFEDIAAEVEQRLSGHLFVAHNVRFDYGFLSKAMRAVGRSLKLRRLCTVQLSRQLYPDAGQHNLDALMQRHGLTCEPRHRALTDARALHEWCTKVGQELGYETLHAAVREQLNGPALPDGVSRATIRALPESPGIYRMFGEADALLYVGKSVNVRGRVLAHFGAASRDPRERRLFEQTRHVTATASAGELGAMLLEVQAIKAEQPVYNRRLRHRASVHTLRLEPVDDYLQPRIATVDPAASADASYGLYRQVSGARRALNELADTHRLCRKRLGLERGAGSCFGLQVGRCAGACTGRQSAVAWNLALMNALGPTRLTAWPFAGVVALGEGRGRQRQWHVVDRWCYLGTAGQRDELQTICQRTPEFDIDVFRIVERFLARSAHRLSIEPLVQGPASARHVTSTAPNGEHYDD